MAEWLRAYQATKPEAPDTLQASLVKPAQPAPQGPLSSCINQRTGPDLA